MVTFRGAEPQTLLAPAICAARDPARFRPAAPVSGSRSAAGRRPPAAGRRASQSAAARGSMPAGAPPPLGRMAQAGRPAGAHILRPERGAHGPLSGRPSEGIGEARGKGGGRPGRGTLLRCGREARVGGAAASPSGAARTEARQRRREQCVSLASSRSPAPRGRRGPGVGVEAVMREYAGRLRAPLGQGALPRLRRWSATLKLAGGSV